MLGKVFGSFIAGILLMTVALQVTSVSAHHNKHPLTSPVTSPITSPTTCKPGWGFGDKNHCHFDFFKFFHKDKDNHHDNDDHGKGHDRDDDNLGEGHH